MVKPNHEPSEPQIWQCAKHASQARVMLSADPLQFLCHFHDIQLLSLMNKNWENRLIRY